MHAFGSLAHNTHTTHTQAAARGQRRVVLVTHGGLCLALRLWAANLCADADGHCPGTSYPDHCSVLTLAFGSETFGQGGAGEHTPLSR